MNDYTKLNEDLIDMVNADNVDPTEVLNKKKAIVNTVYGTDLDLNNASEEDVDKLIANMPLEEKISEIIENMELQNGSEMDMKEAIRVYTGMKLEEAELVLKDKRING